jgi:hypothetical protein
LLILQAVAIFTGISLLHGFPLVLLRRFSVAAHAKLIGELRGLAADLSVSAYAGCSIFSLAVGSVPAFHRRVARLYLNQEIKQI